MSTWELIWFGVAVLTIVAFVSYGWFQITDAWIDRNEARRRRDELDRQINEIRALQGRRRQ